MYALIPERVATETATLEVDLAASGQLSKILQEENTCAIAFQSVLVAAIQILERVRADEIAVSHASISLGQRQTLDQMLASLEPMIQTLRAALNDKGARILDLQPRDLSSEDKQKSWWFCLAGAIETINAGIDWMKLIVAGQAQDSPCKKLTAIVSSFLENHLARLKIEIQQ